MRRYTGIAINLLEKEGIKSKRMVCILGLLFLLLLCGGMALSYRSVHGEMLQEQRLNKQLKEEAGKLSSLSREGTMEEKQGENISRKDKLLKELYRQEVSYLAAIREIEKNLPPGVILGGIEMEKGRIILQGYAADHQELSLLVSALREKTFWGEPSMLNSSVVEDREELEFNLEINRGDK